MIPPPQPTIEEEEEQIIHRFEAELGNLDEKNQPPLQEGDDAGRESDSELESKLPLFYASSVWKKKQL